MKHAGFYGVFHHFSFGALAVNPVLSGARGHVDNVLKVFSTVQIKSTQIPEGWSLWHMDIRTDTDRYSPARSRWLKKTLPIPNFNVFSKSVPKNKVSYLPFRTRPSCIREFDMKNIFRNSWNKISHQNKTWLNKKNPASMFGMTQVQCD